MANPSKPTTHFTPQAQPGQQTEPFIHPAVAASPEAMAYAAGMQARQQGRRGGLQKYTEQRPVEGPAIPPLEASPQQGGGTMEQQAAMYGAPPAQTAQQGGPNSIIEGPQFGLGSMQPGAPPRPMTPQQMGLQMTDVLHPEAQNDPNFIQGNGSMMAVNQPAMAMKYGIIRNNQHIPPQALQANVGGGGGASPGRRSMQDTIRDMQAAAAAQKPPPEVPKTEAEAQKQVEQSAAGASQNIGKKPGEDEERERIRKAVEQLDDFDYDALRQQLNEDAINSPEQRRIIEERLEALSLDDLILKDRVQQRVPIILPTESSKGFSVTYESMTGADDLSLKRLLMQESKSVEVTDRYLLDKFALMSLAAGVVAINDNPVPHKCHNADGDFDDKQFWLKFEWLIKRGLHVLAAMGANHTWFEMRVRNLMVAEKVKNG